MEENKNELILFFECLVRRYYDFIDSNNFENLYDLFSEQIIYERNGVTLYGKEEFINFYENIRKLSGAHIIHSLVISKNNVTVSGGFTGTNNGKNTNFQFIDIFTFSNDGKIIHRKTTY